MKKLIEIIERDIKIQNLPEILDYIDKIPVNEIIKLNKLMEFSKLTENELLTLLSILKCEEYLTIRYKTEKNDKYYKSLEDLVKDFPEYELDMKLFDNVQIYFKRHIKKEIDEGDYIVFEWNDGIKTDLQVADITKVYSDKVLVHFLDGYKSEAEFIKFNDILGKGNSNGLYKLYGWSGNYDIYDFENQLIKSDIYNK